MAVIQLVPGLFALLRMRGDRLARIEAAPEERKPDPVSDMARAMHPEELRLTVASVKSENETARTYRLAAAPGAPALPVFQPGQYLSVKATVPGDAPAGASRTSRAYTIASAPREAEGKDGFYEITVRRKPGGFVSPHIFDTWAKGTEVTATGPHGEFCWSPLRDTGEVVALAGGTGITPFLSMMRQWAQDGQGRKLTLLYGCKDPSDELFSEETDELCLRHPDLFRRANTYERLNGGKAGLRQGFLDAAFIREHVPDPESKTYFICGPTVMYRFLRGEFEKLGQLERKQTRFEACGAPDDVTILPGFPKEAKGRVVDMTVRIGNYKTRVAAASTESVLSAVERAGLVLDSRCRSGECGICRSRLICGDVFILPDNDGRRAVDKELGYIHPCSTYPLSDLTIVLPPGKTTQT